MGKHFEVTRFSPTYLYERLASRTQLVDYLKGYLSDMGARTVLLEKQYVDKDFLIDYSSFYSRTFTQYERFSRRYHFFSFDFDEAVFTKGLRSREFAQKLQNEYLGFITQKPTDRTVIGRSLLRHYPLESERECIRQFPTVVSKNTVHLCGLKLYVPSLRYQEQDKAVSACATVAIWASLHKLGEIFDIPSGFSPFEITEKANNLFPSSQRVFPSEGLNEYQISAFFKSLSLDVEFVNIPRLRETERTEFVKSILYAYLRFGIPIIAGISLWENENPGLQEPPQEFHAVTLTGFKIRSSEWKSNRANNIEELYAHDDQIGPFSKIEFRDNDPCNWDNEWRTQGRYKRAILTSLFIPVYYKIRFPFSHIYRITEERPFQALKPASFEILLVNSSDYKTDMLKCNPTNMIERLSINMPLFLWIIRVHGVGRREVDLVFDATDTIPKLLFPVVFP